MSNPTDKPLPEPSARSESDDTRKPKFQRWLQRASVLILAAQWTRFIAQAASVVVLAHFIGAAAFGLVTMVTAVIGLAGVLGDFGLSLSALASRSVTDRDRSNLLWANVTLGAILTAAVAGAAPVIAAVYARPQLEAITLALSVTFFLNAAATQFRVEMNLSGRWRRLAATQAIPALSGLLVSTVIAATTHSYWALVVQQVWSAGMTLMLSITLSGWRPSRPRPSATLREHLRFGRDAAAVQTLNYLASNADSFIIGRSLGASQLGDYGRAYQLAVQPVLQIASPLSRIVLPRLAAAPDRLARHKQLVVYQRLLVYCQLLPLSFLVGTARPLVLILLGRQWRSVPYLTQIEAIGAACSAVGYIFYWAFLAERRAALLVISEGVCEVLMVVAMLLVVHFGTPAVAWTVTAGQFTMMILSAAVAGRVIGAPITALARTSARPVGSLSLAAGATAMSSKLLSAGASNWSELGVQAGVWCVILGLCFWLLPGFQDDFRAVREVVTRTDGV